MGSSLVQKDSDGSTEDIPIVKELQQNPTQPEDDTEIQIQRLAKSIKLDDAVKEGESSDDKSKASDD